MSQTEEENQRPSTSVKIDIDARDRLKAWIAGRRIRTNNQDVVTQLVHTIVDLDDESATVLLLNAVCPEDRAAFARVVLERMAKGDQGGEGEEGGPAGKIGHESPPGRPPRRAAKEDNPKKESEGDE